MTPPTAEPRTAADLEPQVAQLVGELTQLVRMAARRPDLVLTVGPPDCGWSFRWTDALVQVDPGDLTARAPDLCRGLVVHEAAHAAVTRLQDLLPIAELGRLMPLLNVVEDCRIETWIRARFPGAAPWVRAYNDVLFGEMRAAPQPRSRQAQFGRALLERWWFGDASAGLHPAVGSALTRTAGAVEQAISRQPPVDAAGEAAALDAAVLDAQSRMWRDIEAGVLPFWERLGQLDAADGLSQVGARELAGLLAGLGAAGHLTPAAASAPARRVPAGDSPGGAASRAAAANAISSLLRTNGTDDYLGAWRRIQPLCDRVADEFIRVLIPRKRLSWSRDHPWGTRLDLRRAMQMSADPRVHDKLWMRPVMPDRRDPEFVLLLDRSSSMSSQGRMKAAFDGLVLLVEASRRAGIRTSVWSFSNRPRCDLAPDAPLDDAGRKALGRLLKDCNGSTHLADALEAVRGAFARSGSGQKVLFVLSDGEPSDADAAKRSLAALGAEGVRSMGLGLGQGTAGLRALFGTVVVDVPVDEVARRIGGLLLAALDD